MFRLGARTQDKDSPNRDKFNLEMAKQAKCQACNPCWIFVFEVFVPDL